MQHQLLTPTLLPLNCWERILSNIEGIGQQHAQKSTAKEKKILGQIFTPLPMARQLVSLVTKFTGYSKDYGDPGTGAGILSAALLARHHMEHPNTPPKSLTAFEIDETLHSNWNQTFADVGGMTGMKLGDIELQSDFYAEADSILSTGAPKGKKQVDRLIMNPPYKKLGAKEPLSLLLKKHDIYAPNHYASFLALGVTWLNKDGEILAIIPRSFFNGSYFKRFRCWLSSKMSIEHVVVYSGRSNFGANVLQENICLYLKKRDQTPTIRISFCEHAEATPEHDILISSKQMLGKLWVLPSKPSQLNALEKNLDQPHTLDTLGLTVNTGAIEVHRPECKVSKPCTVLYSRDFDSSANVTWNEKTKPRFYASARGVMPLPDNKSGYVVLKRITANDGNKNRLMPAWISKESTGLSEIGFDNHVQVISSNGKPLSKTKGLALVLFLSSIEANECMSAISGTTQINIDDLKALRYPNIDKVTHK